MADTEFLMPPFQAPSSENKTPPFSFGIPTEKQKPVSTEENVTLTISGMLTGEYTDGQTGITVATVTITIEKAA